MANISDPFDKRLKLEVKTLAKISKAAARESINAGINKINSHSRKTIAKAYGSKSKDLEKRFRKKKAKGNRLEGRLRILMDKPIPLRFFRTVVLRVMTGRGWRWGVVAKTPQDPKHRIQPGAFAATARGFKNNQSDRAFINIWRRTGRGRMPIRTAVDNNMSKVFNDTQVRKLYQMAVDVYQEQLQKRLKKKASKIESKK